MLLNRENNYFNNEKFSDRRFPIISKSPETRLARQMPHCVTFTNIVWSPSALIEFKKVLVPTDYSELSLAALDYASTFSKLFGAQVYLLHTLDTIPVLALEGMDLTTEKVIYETEINAKTDLHTFVVSRIQSKLNLIEVVRKGIAEDEIVKFAESENIDLIVMATHGRSGIAHVLMGSVAEKVIQRSRVPVLIVKPTPAESSAIPEERNKEYSERVLR